MKSVPVCEVTHLGACHDGSRAPVNASMCKHTHTHTYSVLKNNFVKLYSLAIYPHLKKKVYVTLNLLKSRCQLKKINYN